MFGYSNLASRCNALAFFPLFVSWITFIYLQKVLKIMKTILAVLAGLLMLGCIQVSTVNNITIIPPGYEVKDYCVKDSDCVRQNKCCDCGLGDYVNRYNLDNPNCTGPRCMCPIALSEGVCNSSRCAAVAVRPAD